MYDFPFITLLIQYAVMMVLVSSVEGNNYVYFRNIVV